MSSHCISLSRSCCTISKDASIVSLEYWFHQVATCTIIDLFSSGSNWIYAIKIVALFLRSMQNFWLLPFKLTFKFDAIENNLIMVSHTRVQVVYLQRVQYQYFGVNFREHQAVAHELLRACYCQSDQLKSHLLHLLVSSWLASSHFPGLTFISF